MIFSQRDASENQESFVEFAEKLEAAWQPFTIKIVLAANEDIRELPGSEEFEHPAGISIFSQSLDSGSNCCAIIAKTSFRNRISQGGGGTVAPIWLVKSIKDSCEESSVSAWLPNSASFLYRLGFMGEDSNISPFLSDSIPAAGLYLDDMEDCLSILPRTLEKLSAADTSSWDVHYSYVSILSLEFWLDEAFFLFFYITAAFIVLIRLCFSTVRVSDRNKAIVKDLSKAWYLILVLFAFTALVLQLMQSLPSPNPPFAVTILGQKLVGIIAASLLLFMLLSRIKGFMSFESISRIMLFMAAFNIFVFCAIDISFLFLFFFEYLACLVAYRTKQSLTILATTILLALPFIPHGSNILLSSSPMSLARLAKPGLGGNLLFALILLPIQLQTFRLLLKMDFFSRRKKRLAILQMLSSLIFIAACVASFAAFYALVIRTIIWSSIPAKREDRPTKRLEIPPKFEPETEGDFIEVSYDSDIFMEYTFTSMTVKASEGAQVLRHEISLETESGIPLNDCNYNYSLSGRHKAYLAIPDNPSATVSIVFTSAREVSPIAFISRYIRTADGKYIIEKDALNMPSQVDKK
ncbi:MAG: hypothetical protein IJU95_10840 [Treponema sp.]|nr:hypothetical protein [Treponema sp.]